MNLTNVVQSVASQHPDRVAIVERDRRFTYLDLARRVAGLAAGLVDHGVRPGDTVAILVGSRAEHLESLLAVGRIGAIAMAVDHHWREVEVADVLERFEAQAVIVERDSLEVTTGPWRSLGRGRPPIVIESTDGVGYESLAENGRDADVQSRADAPFLIMLSSGTTGKPKGALVTHGAMAFRFLAQIVEFGLSSRDVYLNLMPMYHGGGRSFSLSHLYLGGKVMLVSRFDPDEVDALVRGEAVTTTTLVPTMVHRILARPAVRPWPTMRALIASGAPLPLTERIGVLDRLTAGLWDYYASVEAGGVSILRPEDQRQRSDSVGRPMWGTEVRIDGSDGRRAGSGEVGDIRYRSPGMISSYRGGIEDDSIADGWYRTGDLGRIDEDGFLSLAGRSKEMIISGGVNVFPAEVEAALCEHASVARAAVIGQPDAEWGEKVVAFVVPDGVFDQDSVAEFLRGRLGPAKRPKAYHLVTDLPTTAAGKIDRAALRSLLVKSPL